MRANNPEVSLTLLLEDVNNLLTWLGDRPFNQVADMIVEIRNQVNRQLQELSQRAQQQMPVPQRINGEDRAPAP